MNKQILLLLALSAMVGLAAVSCDKTPIPSSMEIPLSPANSHIISVPGAYSFQPVKGNSSEPVGTVASADVLWESFGTAVAPSKGDVIAQASYDTSDGLIHFMTPVTLKNGNALIAAKDASGNILWSWHIWVSDGWDPAETAHTYYNDAGIMMDRNLGALSATPGDVTALGLLFQWGRKDPFLGSSSIRDDIDAASTLTWPEPVVSTKETGTIAYSIAHPTTFITTRETNYDWYYTGEFSTDNTRWQEEKTIYDPCPAGWKLPHGISQARNDFWMTALGRHFIILSMDPENYGVNLTGALGDADPIWYPFPGYRVDYSGELWNVGNVAGAWSATVDTDEGDPVAKVMALGLEVDMTLQGDFMFFPSYDYCRAFAIPVRCVADSPTR